MKRRDRIGLYVLAVAFLGCGVATLASTLINGFVFFGVIGWLAAPKDGYPIIFEDILDVAAPVLLVVSAWIWRRSARTRGERWALRAAAMVLSGPLSWARLWRCKS